MTVMAIIGHPLGHTLSPAMYNAAFPAIGVEAIFEAWPTPPDDIVNVMQRIRQDDCQGICVTVPHKAAVMSFVDEIDPGARAIGAVNCITSDSSGRLVAYNTDKYGFIRSLREAGCEPEGMNVVVLGAGGSAHAVTYGLVEAGVTSLSIANRSRERLDETLEHLRQTAPRPVQLVALGWQDDSVTQACGAADLIVNCTSVGMTGTSMADESPLCEGDIKAGVWVYDLVYRPLDTVLLRSARSAGARPIAGLEMLIYQAVQCLELWTGREAPVDIMRKAAYDGLGIKE